MLLRSIAVVLLALGCTRSGSQDGSDGYSIVRPLETVYRLESSLATTQGGGLVVESFSHLHRTADSLLLVGDSKGHRVVAFAPSGEIRWTSGQAGEGPGDFGAIGGITSTPTGNILVYDHRLRRLTTLSAQGRYLESFDMRQLDAANRPITLLGSGPAGELWIRLHGLTPRSGARQGINTVSTVIAGLDAIGRLRLVDSMSDRVYSTSDLGSIEIVLGPRALVAMSGERIVSHWTATDSIRTDGLSGALGRRSIGLPRARRLLTPEEVASAREASRPRAVVVPSATANQRKVLEQLNATRTEMFDATPAADSIGPFDAIIGDGEGGAWFRLWSLDDPAGSRRESWVRFLSDLSWGPQVQMPDASRLLWAHHGRLYVEQVDQDGVPTLEVWAIR